MAGTRARTTIFQVEPFTPIACDTGVVFTTPSNSALLHLHLKGVDQRPDWTARHVLHWVSVMPLTAPSSPTGARPPFADLKLSL